MEISNSREASLDGKVSELSPQNWATIPSSGLRPSEDIVPQFLNDDSIDQHFLPRTTAFPQFQT
jgi:hypothetical protein